MNKLLATASLLGLSLLISSCMDQYNPRPYWAQFRAERLNASIKIPKLTETGEIPSAEDEGGSIDEAYQTYCASCHGAQGHGDGAAGVALDPKPRDLTDAVWHNDVTDEHIHKVIAEGGGSVGLSPSMPPWLGILTDEQITQMVELIRNFKQ